MRTLSLLFLLAACPSDDVVVPEPTPAPSVDLTLPAGPGEARAGLVTEDNAAAVLFGGIASEGQPGDVLLFNDRVRFVVQGPRLGHGYVNTGGHLIDADLVRGPGEVGQDVLEDQFLAFGIGWLFHADSVEVVQDGREGGPVLIRSTGRAMQWEFIAGVGESPDPIVPDPAVAVVREYALAPDAHVVSIRTTFTNEGTETARFNPSDGWMAAREVAQTWSTDEGLDPSDLDRGAVGEAGRAGEPVLGMWSPEGPMDPLAISGVLSGSGILIFGGGWHDVEPGDTYETQRWFGLAQDVNTLEAVRLESAGEQLGAVSGRVLDPAGEPVPGARVHFFDDASPPRIAGYALADEAGNWSAQLPLQDWNAIAVGEAASEQVPLPPGAGRVGPFTHPGPQGRTLAALDGSAPGRPWASGHLAGAPVSVTPAEDEAVVVDLSLGDRSELRLRLNDDSGAPLDGYVELRAQDDLSPAVPDEARQALGLAGDPHTILGWFAGGEATLDLPPGRWNAHLESSYRHERVVLEDLDVPVGGLDLEQALAERIPLDGWVSVDSHLHAAPSGDGDLPMEDRLIACAATGIQFPVTTDHDAAADYQPLGAALGLHDRTRSINGLEVSPVVRGHFNMFPFAPDPTEAHNGAEPWWDYPETTDELMERMRIRRPEALIQVNHGRAGMMDFANFNNQTGQPGNPNKWSWNFDVFEMAASEQDDLVQDFFTFLNHGPLRTPVGVSDSHSRDSTCGKGRTDVFVGTDDVTEVTDSMITDAILAGHVVVARGITVRASVGDSLPGDVITSGELAVRVEALPWMRPTELRLYRNGVVVETRPMADEADGAVWFDDVLPLEAGADAWFVVEVTGGSAMGGVWKGTAPWAMTNAFLFDAGDDGWEPPLGG